jgi:deoxyribodipyrimidine photo-lyase
MPRDLTAPTASTTGSDAAPTTLVWLRRDLRLEDHAALAGALAHPGPIQLVFVFDTAILSAIPRPKEMAVIDDRRVAFIHAALEEMSHRLRESGAHLIVQTGDPTVLIPEIAQQLKAARVIAAHDDEPYATTRDQKVRGQLHTLGIGFETVKDQCIFERQEVLTGSGKPFSVFTPYKNAWLKRLTPADLAPRSTGAGKSSSAGVGRAFASRLLPRTRLPKLLEAGIPSLESLGFSPGNLHALKIPLGESGGQTLFQEFQPRIGQYKDTRDFPAVKGPSYLSVHLRFGTISIRQCAAYALTQQREHPDAAEGAGTWLSELIWRDFYMQILSNNPHVASKSFKPDYDAITWEDSDAAEHDFIAWTEGRTGYPIVDAAMRQLNATGYMHNRLRMIVASFLTKDLGIDWRRGEAYFAWKLNDFDLAANNGGWQWAASTGCDAQPYFRIFNPVSQSERFDPKGSFIRRYVPEIAALADRDIHAPWQASPISLSNAGIQLGVHYPTPIVDHDAARKKTLMRFSVVKKQSV